MGNTTTTHSQDRRELRTTRPKSEGRVHYPTRNHNLDGANVSTVGRDNKFRSAQSKEDGANVSATSSKEVLLSIRGDLPQADSRSKQNLANAMVPRTVIHNRDASPVIKNCATITRKVDPDTAFPSSQNLNCKPQSSNFIPGKRNRQEFRLFLGGLPDKITETELKAVFESFGEVTDVRIVLDKETKKSKRYGFLEFADENSFEKCFAQNFIVINGRWVEIKKAWPRGHSKEEKDDKKGWSKKKDCEKPPLKLNDLEKLTNSSAASSLESELNSKNNQLPFEKLFEDYLKARFAVKSLLNSGELADAAYREKTKSQEQERKSELEKWLAGLSASANGGSPSRINAHFSSDSSETDLEETEVENEGTGQPDQMEFPPQPNGQLGCAICAWTPLNNSFDDLLAHCKTPIHRQKLRERFKVNESQKKRGRRNKSRSRNKQQELSIGTQDSPEKNKALVLTEIIKATKVKSGKLICKICDIDIPPSEDIRILMMNLSHHLQGKKHLQKIWKGKQ